jgi:hypothetical protein
MEAQDGEGYSIPFSLKIVTYDEQKQTGGDLIEFESAEICRSGKTSRRDRFNSEAVAKAEQIRKNPNHRDNLTRNIRLLPSGNIRKIHIHHILRLNGERVF